MTINKELIKPTDEKLSKIEKVLKEPVFIQFTDETINIRRNLIITSFVTLIYKLCGLTITAVPLFCIRIDKDSLSSNDLDTILCCIVFYHFIHFFWQSWDTLKESVIRVTGTRLFHITTGEFADNRADYTNNPRQSSLLNWFLYLLNTLDYNIKDIKKTNYEKANEEEIILNLQKVSNDISNLYELIKEKNIDIRLKRFEKYFTNFSISQILRFWSIELLFPICIGFWSICITFPYCLLLEKLELCWCSILSVLSI